MKLTSLLIAVFGLAATLSAGKSSPSPVSVNCVQGSGGVGTCGVGFQAEFTGTGYPSRVLVTCTSAEGTVLDQDTLYHAPGGTLDVFETLDPGGTYTFEVDDAKGNFIDSVTIVVD